MTKQTEWTPCNGECEFDKIMDLLTNETPDNEEVKIRTYELEF